MKVYGVIEDDFDCFIRGLNVFDKFGDFVNLG